MWEDFNIKTFPAETVVYRDGAFCSDLSTLESADINKNYDLPVHIIYIGEIAGKCRLDINVTVENQPVVVTVKIKNKLPAFLNIFIKNAGKNSEIRANVLLENTSELTFDCSAQHLCENTGIFVKTKLIAGQNSISKLSGMAMINRGAENAGSNISFVAMADASAKIQFMPGQKISATPHVADHSAGIYKSKPAQIQFLRAAGLGTDEVDSVMKEAFINDF